MLKIGFILPSSDYLHDPFKGDPHTHFQILTTLENHFGNRVELLLIDLRAIKKEFAIRHVPECDLYLYSVYTLDYHEQTALVESLRQHYPRARHIAGGPHTNTFAEQCLQIFDSIILGDGEHCIVRLVEDCMNSVPRTVYKQEAHIDINVFPPPLRRYLPKSTIARKNMMTLKTKQGYNELLGTTTLFSRGCPYACAFCAMPRVKGLNQGIRYRDARLIEEEIEYLKHGYCIQGINILDEIGIPLNRKKAISTLEAIGRTGIVWRGQCRVDGISPELAKLARESGCVAMGLGVESASQRVLDIINKKIDVQRAKETIRVLKQNDIETRIYMILGLPGEPDDIVKRTEDFIQETSPDLVYLSLFTVRPGTEVYNHPEKFGIKKIDMDWGKTMHMFGRFEHETPTLTFEYERQSPWGVAPKPEKVISNYIELQTKLREQGLSSI